MTRHELIGQPAAPGIAVGRLVRLGAGPSGERRAGTPDQERAALAAAIDSAIADLASLAEQSGGDAADILQFQIAMLEDDALRDPALSAIEAGAAAERAWAETLAEQVADYEAAEDAYFRARAADLRDLMERVRGHLLGTTEQDAIPPGAIVVAHDITPSRFLAADWRAGGGVALAAGSKASHVAMLARARGVPMVVGLGPIATEGHARAALDGAAGRLWLSPDAADEAGLADIAAHARQVGRAVAALSHRPAATARGQRVLVQINIADPAELDGLDPALCDGVGLVRTELLFSAGGGLPDEERQYQTYRRILAWAAGRPVTIRTLDAGGDKPIAGLTFPDESNPFLGVRGIRLSLTRPDVFAVQLRALARAARHGPLRIMLPMVTVPDELEAARDLLTAACMERGAPPPPLGMMVEVPAAALAIERFDAAFFSIGSNDLTQYVTASARDIAAVAPLADVRNPGVLRLIADVAAHGERIGREVCLCGDAAGEPALVPALLDTGLTSLSMAPNAVGAVKAAIAQYG